MTKHGKAKTLIHSALIDFQCQAVKYTLLVALFSGFVPSRAIAAQLMTVFLPFTYLQNTSGGKTNTSSAEVGLGVDYSWFLDSSLALSVQYEVNMNLPSKSIFFSGLTLGFSHFLAGGAPATVQSGDFSLGAVPKANVLWFAGLANKEFDFSAFDTTAGKPTIDGKRPITKGNIWAVAGGLGADMSLGSRTRCGMRLQANKSISSSVKVSLLLYEGWLTVGYSL